jgi:hypothetical protein
MVASCGARLAAGRPCHSRRSVRGSASVLEPRERGTIPAMPDAISTRPLLDKLGVRPGSRVAVAGVDDPTFRRLLVERVGTVSELAPGDVPPGDMDLVFLAADTIDELTRIGVLRPALVPDGAIWVVSRKGRQATLRDVDVIDAAKSMDLVDNKVVSFSPTHTALRLVIPKALRPASRPASRPGNRTSAQDR